MALPFRQTASRLREGLSYTGHILPTVLGILVLNFFLLQLVPGDAADIMAAEAGAATEETLALYREHLGLNIPVAQQFWNYLTDLARLDLGYSFRYNAPVFDVIMSRLPATLILMGSSYIVGLVLGVGAGIIMAIWRNQWPDRVLNVIVVLLFSIPSFCVGLFLVILLSVQLGWLPSDGSETIGASLSGWELMLDRAKYLVLPTIALSSNSIAVYARLTRSAMLEVQKQDFVRTAEAKGVPPLWVTLRHVLRNALIPVSTVAGLRLGALLGGAATVEMVFSWPGIGRLSLEAVQARDYNTLLGILLLSSLVIVLANLFVDLLHRWIDPRSRRREASGPKPEAVAGVRA
ncbi:MAG: ABC transporter permease [Asticcacaulis sp.]